MSRKLFGTDGVRGKANQEPMTAETVMRLGMAAGREFTRGDHRHTVVIGKDTRLSGYMLEPALVSGFTAVGMDVVLLGPTPTPAVAMLTRSLRADLGVVISASHNEFEDNGIKFFGPDGYKLSDEVELSIESRVFNGLDKYRVGPADLGRVRRLDDGNGRYIEYVKSTFPRGLRLDGMKIVVDCAHGAAYKVAPAALWELGAEVISIGVEPNGTNINAGCGATAAERMRAAVIANRADLGMALDGDADRVVLSDENGALVDGDQVLALIARSWHEAGNLMGGGVVTTVMSNLGLERFLAGMSLQLIRTAVGDRYVVDRMRSDGYNLGGEQSGHIVLGEHSTTGDGLVAGLQVAAAVVQTGRPASAVTRQFHPLPQVLRSVPVTSREVANEVVACAPVATAIAAGEQRLNGCGRVLIRKSGTEPVIRVMAEGEDETLVGAVVSDICDAISGATTAVAAQ